jgi:hypothetical protein
MPLINLVIILVIVGACLYGINAYVPMQSTMKKILNATVIIVVELWLLSIFGVVGNLSTIHVGR